MSWKFWKQDESKRIGTCQCGHLRCFHFDGIRGCNSAFERNGTLYKCACEKYIYSGKSGIVRPSLVETDSEVEQLKKMTGLK